MTLLKVRINSDRPSVNDKIHEIKRRASLTAKGVREILNIDHSEIFLQAVYIPFFAHFTVWDSKKSKAQLKSSFVNNLDELLKLATGYECRGTYNERQFNVQATNTDCDLLVGGGLNLYEKAIYLLLGITYSGLEQVETEAAAQLQPDVDLRATLRQFVFSSDDQFADLIDLLPLTLFEGLKRNIPTLKGPLPSCYWLGPIYSESYLLYLAALKEMGVVIFGQPHGGMYCQTQLVSDTELAERALVDIYSTPVWNFNGGIFPNWRASRNLFLSLKCLPLKKINKNKMLVVLGFFYMEPEPRSIDNLTGELLINDFYEKLLITLGDHFDSDFDFKIYPRQKLDVLPKLEFLSQRYLGCKFITEGTVLENSVNYSGVIHMDTWGTAVMELAASRVSQYIYLGPEVRLDKGYENFLWNSRRISTRDDYSCGCYVLVDNTSYRKAYGASFLYPFYFAALVRRIKKTKRLKPIVLN